MTKNDHFKLKPTTPPKRIDMVLLIEVCDANPNGDPAMGNQPRRDPVTDHGIMTAESIKRKLRDTIVAKYDGVHPNGIYIRPGYTMRNVRESLATNLPAAMAAEKPKATPQEKKDGAVAMGAAMRGAFFDVRALGMVADLSKFAAANHRGAIQFTPARSIDPVDIMHVNLVRTARETEKAAKVAKASAKKDKDAEVEIEETEDGIEGGDVSVSEVGGDEGSGGTMFGQRFYVPYGLYRAHIFYSPLVADKNDFSHDDLALFRELLPMMFETTRSAGRGLMSVRGLYAFEHSDALGNAQAADLFDQIEIKKVAEAPRSLSDYQITGPGPLPKGVSFEVWAGKVPAART